MRSEIQMLHIASSIAAGHMDKKNFLLAALVKRKDGAIVIAHNAKTEQPMPSCHAEARALKKADAGAILYVARVTRDGAWAMSKPCKTCQSYIRNKHVKRVYYTIGPNEYGVWDVSKNKNP